MKSPEIHVDVRCPFCHAAVGRDEAWVACAGCLARHHTACWQDDAGCAACSLNRHLVTPSAARPRGPGIAEKALVFTALLGCLGGGAALGFSARPVQRAAPSESTSAPTQEVTSREQATQAAKPGVPALHPRARGTAPSEIDFVDVQSLAGVPGDLVAAIRVAVRCWPEDTSIELHRGQLVFHHTCTTRQRIHQVVEHIRGAIGGSPGAAPRVRLEPLQHAHRTHQANELIELHDLSDLLGRRPPADRGTLLLNSLRRVLGDCSAWHLIGPVLVVRGTRATLDTLWRRLDTLRGLAAQALAEEQPPPIKITSSWGPSLKEVLAWYGIDLTQLTLSPRARDASGRAGSGRGTR